MQAAQNIIDSVKATVKEGVHRDGRKILQVELYLRWLEGFDFVLTAIEVNIAPNRNQSATDSLNADCPGC